MRHHMSESPALTRRQEEVLELVAKGHTNGEIAELLGISVDGAKWHVGELLMRFNVESREELVERWESRPGRVRRVLAGLPLLVSRRALVASGAVAGVAGFAVVVAAVLTGSMHANADGSTQVPTSTAYPTCPTSDPGWNAANCISDGPSPGLQQLAIRTAQETAEAELPKFDALQQLPGGSFALVGSRKVEGSSRVLSLDRERSWAGAQPVSGWYFQLEAREGSTRFVVDLVMAPGGSVIASGLHVYGDGETMHRGDYEPIGWVTQYREGVDALPTTFPLGHVDGLPGSPTISATLVGGHICVQPLSLPGSIEGWPQVCKTPAEIAAAAGRMGGFAWLQGRPYAPLTGAGLYFPAGVTRVVIVEGDGTTRTLEPARFDPALRSDASFLAVTLKRLADPPVITVFVGEREVGTWQLTHPSVD